jgi:predicted transcriptional regulator
MKEMTGEQRELLRNSILLALNARRPLGMPTGSILVAVKCNGFQTLENDELEKQIRYLFSHGMIDVVDREMNRANVQYVITAKGVEWLDGQGLI